MRVRVDAVIFSVFPRERELSLFLFRTVASQVLLSLSLSSCYNIYFIILKRESSGDVLLIIASVN